ncbi:hypothetical protein PC128_g10507 [Phytophthora cactorum]|nr:hypothetical protein PC120_g7553 [Phytophthora cactorum]KAG3192555.1 hypothetical protein PC128_g10507 [Phytophthora cactorum]
MIRVAAPAEEVLPGDMLSLPYLRFPAVTNTAPQSALQPRCSST